MKNEDKATRAVAVRIAPPIAGLYVFPSILPDETAQSALAGIADHDLFSGGKRDQVMLFGGPRSSSTDEDYDPILEEDDQTVSTLPPYLITLLSNIEALIIPQLPAQTLQMIFDQPLSRQIIINLYPPGEGISPHVDLPHRYADGILGVSLCGGCVMVLRNTRTFEEHHIYLPSGTVYCLTGDARWEWTHGIDPRKVDLVRNQGGRVVSIMRDLRVSVTFRWMKEGADELVEGAM